MLKQFDEQLLSIRQAADLLGVSRDTVRRRIISGEIRGEKIKGQWRIPREEVENLLKQLRRKDEASDEIVRLLRERIRELEADKSYLQQRVMALEEIVQQQQRLIETLTPKALPKPGLGERIRSFFRRKPRG